MNEATHGHEAIIRKHLLTATLAGGKTTTHVEIREIEFAPGQKTGLHLHPIPVVGYIAKGEFLFQVEGEATRRLGSGDAFFEPANTRIMHFDNASATEPGTFIAFYLMGEGDAELITMLA